MNVEKILGALEKEYPDARCELNHSSAFELLIATILSAQCTDVRVNKVTEKMFLHINRPSDFTNIKEEELQQYIKSCGLYKNKSKMIIEMSNIIEKDFNGVVPDKLERLLELPGVGRKTANVVLSNAFNIPALAVDTHVFRVANRIGLTNSKNPKDSEEQLMKIIKREEWSKAHHLLIFHGRRRCKAKNPDCDTCVIREDCDYFGRDKGDF